MLSVPTWAFSEGKKQDTVVQTKTQICLLQASLQGVSLMFKWMFHGLRP